MKSRLLVYGALLVVLVYGYLLLSGKIRTPWEASKLSAAKQAINVAQDACGLHNNLLLDQAILNAQTAIEKLSSDDEYVEDASLGNKLALVGCHE